jgi:hypothetical protein
MQVSKLQAFLVHLGISLVIFFILLGFIVFSWYPYPLFDLEGGWQGILIVAGVDVVLGPLLTWIVFKPGKPSLKFDMSAIALLQACALAWGVWTVYDQQPVLIVFTDLEFHPINHYQLEAAGVSMEEITNYPRHSKPIAVVRLPEDPDELKKLKWSALMQFGGLHMRGDLYEPLNDKNIQKIFAQGISAEKIKSASPEVKQKFEKFLQNHDAKDYALLPLWGRYKRVFVAMHRPEGTFTDIIDVEPVVENLQ